jgi:hypothetical protein
MANPRDEVGSGPDENEPKSITIEGRSFAGASYGANADEHRDDRRGANDAVAGDVADGGISEKLPNDDGR